MPEPKWCPTCGCVMPEGAAAHSPCRFCLDTGTWGLLNLMAAPAQSDGLVAGKQQAATSLATEPIGCESTVPSGPGAAGSQAECPETEGPDRDPTTVRELAAPRPFMAAPKASGRPLQHPAGPRVIAGYEIIGEIGRGGMGVIWKALQHGANRVVALKMILHGSVASDIAVLRFLSEAHAAGSLDHPNIVPIYEVGEADGPFYTMKFIAGQSLALYLKKSAGTGYPDGPRAAVELMIKVAQAVHHAHQHGILHRDLKPGNILLDERKEPFVTDFGLAKIIGEDEGLTLTGVAIGTPSYISPEQAAGQKGVTTATDVYSLGAVLYEMLTGRPPFRGGTVAETIRYVIERDPTPPRSLVPTADRDLEAISLRCLEKAPAARYASAAALAEDLRNWLLRLPILARRKNAAERCLALARRYPAQAALVVLTALVALVGFPGALILWRGSERARLEAVRARTELESSLYFQRVGLVERDMSLNHFHRVESLLEGSGAPGLRGWEWYYLWRWFLREPCLTLRPRVYCKSVRYSPDGRYLACLLADRTLYLYDAMDLGPDHEPTPTAIIPAPVGNVLSIAISRDGRIAFAAEDSTIQIWDASRGADGLHSPSRSLDCRPGKVWGTAYSPDGSRLAACFDDGAVQLWDLSAGEVRSRAWTPHDRAVGLAFSPDGGLIATASFDGTIAISDAATGRVVRRLTGHHTPLTGVTFSPDGSRLASSSIDTTVRIWDARQGRELRTLRGHNGATLAVAYSPDGTRLASSSADQTIKIWECDRNLDILTLRGHEKNVESIGFSPDGRKLASSSDDGTVRIWDGSPVLDSERQERLRFEGHSAMNYGVALSEDAALVASTSADATARLWDPRSGRERLVFRKHGGPVLCADFGLDDKIVATSGSDWNTRIWSAETGQEIAVLPMPSEVCCCRFSGDRRMIATSDQTGLIKIWDASTWKEIRSLSGHREYVWGLSFSPDGRLLASGGYDDSVRVWDVASGRQLHRLPCGTLVRSVDIHPSGRLLASGCSDHRIRVWDPVSGKELNRIDAHSTGVTSVKYSPDGRLLASGAEDGIIKLIDVTTDRVVRELRGHTSRVHALDFDGAGRCLASSSTDATVRIWSCAP